jgi:hypothetical protein
MNTPLLGWALSLIWPRGWELNCKKKLYIRKAISLPGGLPRE